MRLVKLEDAIRIAEARGYKIGIRGDYAYLLAPHEEQIAPETKGHFSAKEAWGDLPQSVIERDGFIENYDWVNQESVQIVDETDSQAMETIIRKHGEWGTNSIVLTRADVEALMNGKAIVWGQGEYSSVIYFTEEKPE